MRLCVCLLFITAAALAQAQNPGAPEQDDVGPTILSRTDMQVPAAVAGEKAGNHFDYFLFSDGIFSTGVQQYNQAPTTAAYGDTAGFDVGGGLDLYHEFRRGSISLAYGGSWHEYTNSNYYN